MKAYCFLFIIFFYQWSYSLFGQITSSFDEKVTSASRVAGTFNNMGIVGNSFSGTISGTGEPSCEFPANSGIEHVFTGGLWVGGILQGQSSVSTAAADNVIGFRAGQRDFEFSSAQDLREKSSNEFSPFFDSTSVSNQDIVASFSDTATSILTDNGSIIPIQGHNRPLGLEVDFQVYNWEQREIADMLLLNINVKNVNTQALDSIFLGYWIDAVVRNVNISPPRGVAFFSKGGNGFMDSLALAYEFDAAGDTGFTNSYIGLQYLGSIQNNACPASNDFNIHYSSWLWRNSSDPLFFFPQADLQKYDRMRKGFNKRSDWVDIQDNLKTPANRTFLLSFGPYESLNPGESIDISLALIFAKSIDDGRAVSEDTDFQRSKLISLADTALKMYYGEDLNRNCILDPGEDLDGDGNISRFDPSLLALRTSVNPARKKPSFHIYPNPTTGYTFIKSDTQIEKVQLFDMRGKALPTILFMEGDLIKVDLSNMPQGVYLLKMSTGARVFSEPLIIQ